jgi:hypothetical protein
MMESASIDLCIRHQTPLILPLYDLVVHVSLTVITVMGCLSTQEASL